MAAHGGDPADALVAARDAVCADAVPGLAETAKQLVAGCPHPKPPEETDSGRGARELTLELVRTVVLPEDREERFMTQLRRPSTRAAVCAMAPDGSSVMACAGPDGRLRGQFGVMVGWDHDRPDAPQQRRYVAIHNPAEHTGFTRSRYHAAAKKAGSRGSESASACGAEAAPSGDPEAVPSGDPDPEAVSEVVGDSRPAGPGLA